MIHLFAGGKSSLEYINEPLEGMKVGINFAFEFAKDLDMLIYIDDVVGYAIQKKYKSKPPFEIVCAKRNGFMIKDWIFEEREVTYGSFTIIFALMWLREAFPDQEIYVHGLDGGDAQDFYDDKIKENYGLVQPETLERIKRLNTCYDQMLKMPCGLDGIFNMNPDSPFKGFEFYED